ncbi:MAG: SGNH/GDSL hydrolase family protein [Deltaproteobacteria bacterium]|nr:SGNH/GDSL hydrolase family protein [Deltaproteobacteria bacterium]
MKQLLLIILVAFIGFFLFQTSLLVWRFHKGVRFADQSVPFEAVNPASRARILVVGDSTGVGTGASRPQDSIAGRLYQDNPHITVVNRSINGARVEDILRQVSRDDDGEFDIVLVQVGGNDILRFTPIDRLHDMIKRVLEEAGRRGRHVIFISTGNVGLAPAFFPPLTWIYSSRTRKVRALFIEEAAYADVEYVDLFKEKDEDPFLRDPEVYYATDYLHPGSEGYRLWYEELKSQTSINSILRTTGGK